MLIGFPVTATTTRNGAQYLAALTLMAPMGRLMQPENRAQLMEQFGDVPQQPFSIHADWPSGVTDTRPVRLGDTITITQANSPYVGQSFAVFGVESNYNLFLKLYVEVLQGT